MLNTNLEFPREERGEGREEGKEKKKKKKSLPPRPEFEVAHHVCTCSVGTRADKL